MYNMKMEEYMDPSKGMSLESTSQNEIKISAEVLEICRTYLETWSIEETSKATGIAVIEIEAILNRKEVRRYIDSVFLEQGYLNRFKINDAFSRLVEKKLEEMEESGIGSNKDLADLLFMFHKMRIDELRRITDENKKGPTSQKNVQINNFGDNYTALTETLLRKKDE